jgi:hypothetical protein
MEAPVVVNSFAFRTVPWNRPMLPPAASTGRYLDLSNMVCCHPALKILFH